MDGTSLRWYFSTMAPPPLGIDFLRTKYGRELLVDAAFVRHMPAFIRSRVPHVLSFHDILLVTRGRGRFLLDGAAQRVAPGTVLFSLPGEIREWRMSGALDGACLFFTAEFVSDAFSDPRFLDQFAYFRARRPSASLALSAGEHRQFLARFAAMRREIARLRDDAPEALRALLYEVLVLLNRWYVARHGEPVRARSDDVVERFRALVARDFRRRHRVADYAAELGLTPGHLNVLCRARGKLNAGALIRARIVLEARRLLLYGDLGVAQIGERLGFDDPAYFARFFRREAGEAPARFRHERL